MVESRVDPAGESVIEGRVNAEFRREAITLRFRYEGQLIEWSKSNTYETIGGREMPAWVSQRRYGIGGGPDMFVKAALRDGSPELVELSFISKPGQSEVRQKHLRAVDLERLVADLYAVEVIESDADASPGDFARAERIAEKFVERQRLPRDYRVITPEFLKEVADVYRRNIDHAPTQAVERIFNVRSRMASEYVDRARRAGYLPPTKQGKKKA